MNKTKRDQVAVFDTISLKLQGLKGRAARQGNDKLVGITYGDRAREAPFQFDTKNGELHRTGCRHLKKDSRLSHFAVWEVKEEDLKFACKKCKPAIDASVSDGGDRLTNMLYGLVSLLDQFGSALVERGIEYRKTDRGKTVAKVVGEIGSGLTSSQRKVVNLAIDGLDSLQSSLKQLGDRLESSGKKRPGSSK